MNGRRSATRADTASTLPGDTSVGSSQAQRPSHEEISRRAYQRWENNGRQDGSDQDHWFAAEQELRGQGAESEPEPDVETRRNES